MLIETNFDRLILEMRDVAASARRTQNTYRYGCAAQLAADVLAVDPACDEAHAVIAEADALIQKRNG